MFAQGGRSEILYAPLALDQSNQQPIHYGLMFWSWVLADVVRIWAKYPLPAYSDEMSPLLHPPRYSSSITKIEEEKRPTQAQTHTNTL